jgi:type IV secretory pathway component VirB8
MTVKELFELFEDFKNNDFAHLRRQVNWIFYAIIAGLFGVIANLAVLIIKSF